METGAVAGDEEDEVEGLAVDADDHVSLITRGEGEGPRRGDLKVVAFDAHGDGADAGEVGDVDERGHAPAAGVNDVQSAGRRWYDGHVIECGWFADNVVHSPAVGGDAAAVGYVGRATVGQHDADPDVLGHDDEVLDGIGSDCGEAEPASEVAAEAEASKSIAGAGGDLDAAALAADDLELAGSFGVDRDDEAILEERVGASCNIALRVGGGGQYSGQRECGEDLLHDPDSSPVCDGCGGRAP